MKSVAFSESPPLWARGGKAAFAGRLDEVAPTSLSL